MPDQMRMLYRVAAFTDARVERGNGGFNMKNPLESLHTTIGLGVALTAIMVLIVAIFYWETGEATAPAEAEPPAAAPESAAPQDGAGATGDAAGTGSDATTTGN